MRRPRAGFASLHSGGPGTRSGGTTTPPQGACWTGTVPKVSDGPRRDKPMRRTGAAAHEETGTETRKRGPGEQKSPRWRAERRHVPETARDKVQWPRPSARHPLDILSGGDSPGPPCARADGKGRRPTRGRERIRVLALAKKFQCHARQSGHRVRPLSAINLSQFGIGDRPPTLVFAQAEAADGHRGKSLTMNNPYRSLCIGAGAPVGRGKAARIIVEKGGLDA